MPDSIKFTELPAGTLGTNSIFATSEDVGGGVYSSTQINAAALGAYLNNALQYAALNTEDNTIIGAINELFVYVQNIANEYNSSSTYDEGDFVIYEGVLYKCTTAITVAEAWTSAHWTSTLVVDNFGAGGASVTLGTTVPSDSSGENGDLYVQYEALTYKVVEYFVKINGSWRKSPYSRVVALTQAEYDLITPDSTTLYIITDAQSSYALKSEIPTKTSDLANDSGFPIVSNNSWGTSITVNYIKSNFILFVGDRVFSLWFSGSGYANPSIRNLGSNQSSSGSGTATLEDVTVTRTSSGFTVTTNSNSTLTVIG